MMPLLKNDGGIPSATSPKARSFLPPFNVGKLLYGLCGGMCFAAQEPALILSLAQLGLTQSFNEPVSSFFVTRYRHHAPPNP